MITIPTVLVLGAGASAHLGYPSGKQLKQDVVNLHRTKPILADYANPPEEADRFIQDLESSGRSSVDEFLEYRREYWDLGRIAIARVLMPLEHPKKAFTAEHKGEDWYHHLFRQMAMDVPFDNFGENQVSFVTFNYDRSLEHFLFTFLQRSYGKKGEEVAAQISKIPITHVYGQLNGLSWQRNEKGRGRPYGSAGDYSAYKDAAREIRIIHEEDDARGDAVFGEARRLIGEAKRVIFLGFGYHRQNIKRLGITGNKPKRDGWYGTACGLTGLERSEIYDFVPFDKNRLWAETVLQFLQRRIGLASGRRDLNTRYPNEE